MNDESSNENICPLDFVKNFSPQKEADLYIHREKKKGILEYLDHYLKINFRLHTFFLRHIANPNDLEIDRARKYMKSHWGSDDTKTVIMFLEEKFMNDHLRKFEYAFLARCLLREGIKKDVIVDMGGGYSYSTITPALLNLYYSVIYSIDILNYPRKSSHGINYVVGDCMHTNLPDNFADVVTIISTLEHVGLGRYGDNLDVDGDVKTMREAWRILKTGGHVILTIPYGFPTVVFNLHRVYDSGRFSLLTAGFEKVLIQYSLLGEKSRKYLVEGKRVSKQISGYYEQTPYDSRHYDPQGGILTLLKKYDHRKSY